jgi:translation initiation factor IF-2
VVVPEAITVQELAQRMAEKGADLVKALFNMDMMVTVNQTIDQDTAELLVEEFGHNIVRVSESDVDIDTTEDVDSEESLKPRPPVVTIMGHVDHGKTSLLDALRGTDVVKGEAGGITQHIGAYQITTKDGHKITVLDTPGHEAFTQMRQRGANVTDIVVLVVAADDGIMPQTIEAINHTKAAGVPMIVAINKVDKPEANPQRIRERLLEHEVVVEAMSGEVQDVEVSAKTGAGLDELIEKILLQAELLELRANPDRPADATVIEAQLDKGRGPVATVLINRGTLKRGDVFVVGTQSGRVRALVDDKGKQINEAGPASPVEVLGLGGVPNAGDHLTVVENEARAREVAQYRQEKATEKRTTTAPASLDTMFSHLTSDLVEFPVVVKADVQGSAEAIVTALHNLSNDDIKVKVLSSGVGAITESDVTLASASKAPVIGFHVRPNAKARELIARHKVETKYYDVIYQLTEGDRQGDGRRARPAADRERASAAPRSSRCFPPASATRRRVCWCSRESSARACSPVSPARTSSSRRPRSPRCGASRTTSTKFAPASNAAWSSPTPTTSSRATTSRCSRSRSANGCCDTSRKRRLAAAMVAWTCHAFARVTPRVSSSLSSCCGAGHLWWSVA